MGSSVSDSRNDKSLQKAYSHEEEDSNNSGSDDDSEQQNCEEIGHDHHSRSSSFFSEFEIHFIQKTVQNHKKVSFRYRIVKKCVGGVLGSVFQCNESVEGISSSRERLTIVKKLNYLPDLHASMEINQKLLEEGLEMHYRHIGRVLNCFKIEHQEVSQWFLVTEYYPLGNLTDVRQSMSEVSVSIMLQVIFQMVMALRFLSSRNLVHRNVKMENILVRQLSNDRLTIVLGDLGSLYYLNGDSMDIPLTSISTFDTSVDTSIIGGLGYRDPLSISKRRIHIKSDIWSLGITLLKFLFFTNLPSTINLEEESQENIEELLNYLFSPLEIKDPAWINIKQIINGMLRINIYERFGTSQILGAIFNASVNSIENLEMNYSILRPVFKFHESVIESVLSRNGLLLRIMPDIVRKNKKLVLKAIENNVNSYEFVYETLKKEGEIMKATFKDPTRRRVMLSRDLTNEEEQELKKHQLTLLQRISKSREVSSIERDDFSFISNLISQDGKLLSFASENLKNNYEIVKKSLLSNGLALQFASLELRKVKELVEIAIDQNPLSLAYAHDSFKDDYEIVKKAVYQNGLALEFASNQLQLSKEIVKIAVTQNFKCLSLISSELICNDPEFICSILSQDSDALEEYEKHWIDVFNIFDWITFQFRNTSSSILYKNSNLLAMVCILEENDLIQIDPNVLFECYVEDSNMKHSYALYKMGILYLNGDEDFKIERNLEIAKQYFEQSAQMGNVDAQMLLVSIYSNDGDVNKLVHHLTSAACQGNSQAQWNLCELYTKGDVVPKNSELSMKWMRKSAQNGNVNAQMSLSNYYNSSSNKDDILSFEWCYLAAEQGFSEAQFQLGEKLMNGIGCQQNQLLSIQYFEKSALEGHVLSMLNLGNLYFQSSHHENHEKALSWYLKASENGNVKAQHLIGQFYLSKHDYEQAFSWFAKAYLNGREQSFSQISQILCQHQLKSFDSFLSTEALKGKSEAIELLQILKQKQEDEK